MSGSLGNKEVMAENLKRYMDMYGEDRKTIAEIAGVSYFTVRDWLVAKNYPRIDKIEILARHWNISKADLVEPLKDREAESSQEPIDLSELANTDDDAVWDKLVSSGGRPLTEKDKAMIRLVFADRWDEITQKAKDIDNNK
ncbi:helix-turn-helix domain-containing protein [Lactococcus lactis]|uniref:Prophage ps1 protein 15 n=1 Tax=Lactococcus lactis subsp. lactis TaxID=1360 RepID=A0A0V8CLC6_LACLL|nr:helix-turn-helix transcriptional regulator [Lactococcus lactis]KSU02096.1 prophage ps1 protein 15 [Lactococcus lactis subsp. lactis]